MRQVYTKEPDTFVIRRTHFHVRPDPNKVCAGDSDGVGRCEGFVQVAVVSSLHELAPSGLERHKCLSVPGNRRDRRQYECQGGAHRTPAAISHRPVHPGRCG